jgi:hypothetical protein
MSDFHPDQTFPAQILQGNRSRARYACGPAILILFSEVAVQQEESIKLCAMSEGT